MDNQQSMRLGLILLDFKVQVESIWYDLTVLLIDCINNKFGNKMKTIN